MIFPNDPPTWSRAGFQKLAFDTFVAAVTDGAVLFVVMLFAIRLVVDDVEVRCFEGEFARLADEASLVPSAG